MLKYPIAKFFLAADTAYISGDHCVDFHTWDSGIVLAKTDSGGSESHWNFPGQTITIDEVEGCGQATIQSGLVVNIQFRMSRPLTQKDLE